MNISKKIFTFLAVFLVVLVIGTIATATYYYIQTTNQAKLDAKLKAKETPSVFNTLIPENPENALNDNEKKLINNFENDPQAAVLAKIALGTTAPEYTTDETWRYDRNPIMTKIYAVDVDKKTFELAVKQPQNKVFTKNITVDANKCANKITFINDFDTKETSQSINNAIDIAEVGDTLITFCLNEECSSVGRICKFVKY